MAKSERQTIFFAERAPLKVTLLVFSGSSIMCVASAVDPLRAALDGIDADALSPREALDHIYRLKQLAAASHHE